MDEAAFLTSPVFVLVTTMSPEGWLASARKVPSASATTGKDALPITMSTWSQTDKKTDRQTDRQTGRHNACQRVARGGINIDDSIKKG